MCVYEVPKQNKTKKNNNKKDLAPKSAQGIHSDALTDKGIFAQKSLNIQDAIHKQHEAEEEGRPKCGCIGQF